RSPQLPEAPKLAAGIPPRSRVGTPLALLLCREKTPGAIPCRDPCRTAWQGAARRACPAGPPGFLHFRRPARVRTPLSSRRVPMRLPSAPILVRIGLLAAAAAAVAAAAAWGPLGDLPPLKGLWKPTASAAEVTPDGLPAPAAVVPGKTDALRLSPEVITRLGIRPAHPAF